MHRGLLREAPEVKFAFIDAEKALHPITKLCRLLEVSRAGFYAWCGRPPSKRAVEDARLAILIREAYERSRCTYGSPQALSSAGLRFDECCTLCLRSHSEQAPELRR